MSAQENLNPQQFTARASSARLYHSTPYAADDPEFNWPPTGDNWVHVGTHKAASDMAGYTAQSSGERPTMLAVRLSGKVYPHMLSDRVANQVSSKVVMDPFHGVNRLHPEHGEDYDIFPYENDAEDPGSTSYVARSTAVRKIATRTR